MSAKPPPLVPNSVPIADVLQRTPALTQLRQRLQDSNARFGAIRGLLPPALAPHVKPGPVDDEGWTLLAANASVAAKLRQLQPRFEESLRERGWQVIAIRIKVQSS
ncbi:DciA family protein [Piscinibacter sp.]|uniref:DciA family protein n=1 Tax=Piscinibacter sp. TaxID=1903157 RepID=UPI002F40A0E2